MGAPTGTLLRFLLPGLLLTLVLVSGCSGDPVEGAKVPPRATPTSTSASPTPDTTEEQVEAAVRAYYAELTRAAQTQDTSQFKQLVTKGCPCFQVATAIQKTKRDGLTTPDAEWTVEEIRVHDLEADLAVAEVHYRVSPYTVLNSQGTVTERYPAQQGHVDLSLVRSERGWIVGNLFDLEG